MYTGKVIRCFHVCAKRGKREGGAVLVLSAANKQGNGCPGRR